MMSSCVIGMYCFVLLSCSLGISDDFVFVNFFFLFFFKQKTAYEMRISDWSSDVCSSDLGGDRRVAAVHREDILGQIVGADRQEIGLSGEQEIGRASCRERVCQYV